MVSPNPSVAKLDQERTIRLAWGLLFGAFTLFCLLFLLLGYTLWNWYTHAMVEQKATLIVRAVEGVTWQRRGRTVFERAAENQGLSERDRVKVTASAGYGQAATLRLFDQSTLDVWAKADVTLETLQTSTWSGREQRVIIQQDAGYVRYDLRQKQPYQRVTFTVKAGKVNINLAPGGSYSLELLPIERRVFLPHSTQLAPFQVDLAVRSGQAEVQSQGHTVQVLAGQRVEVGMTGLPSAPVPAKWELLRDGSFSAYREEEYNNTTVLNQPTLPRALTWQVFSGPSEAGASGYFRLSQGCKPPQTGNDCPPQEQTQAAWFLRSGVQTRGFVTGIRQFLGPDQAGVDISEYRSLVFSAWVRVLYQSIHLAGERGTECPVMIRFLAKKDSPLDAEHERVVCAFTADDPTAEPEHAPGITYYRVEPYKWFQLQIELRQAEWFPEMRYLRSISIYANGHDYDSRVTELSLVGLQTSPSGGP